MIDLHCHLLPAIDDGAKTLSESLELAKAAVAAGITAAVMTPHVHRGRYRNTAASIEKRCQSFRLVLAHRKIPLEIHAGGEVRISSDIIPMVEEGSIPFVGELEGERVILLEFPPSQLVAGAERIVGWLLARGIRPLIAHPERNKDVMGNVEKIKPYVDAGCLLQVTGASLLGEFGNAAQLTARMLVEREWASVVATDAHDMAQRPPSLDRAHAALVRMGGEALARQLTTDTPARIVNRR